VLGGEAFLGTDVIPLPTAEVQTLSIDWSDILWQLRNVQQQGDCKLSATLNHIPNTVALGVAIEARGAVQQTLEIAGVTAGSTAVINEPVPASTTAPAPLLFKPCRLLIFSSTTQQQRRRLLQLSRKPRLTQ